MILTIRFSFKQNQSTCYDRSILQGLVYSVLLNRDKNLFEELHGSNKNTFSISQIYGEAENGFYKSGTDCVLSVSSFNKDLIDRLYEGFLVAGAVPFSNLGNEIIIKDVKITSSDFKINPFSKINTSNIVLSIGPDIQKLFGVDLSRGIYATSETPYNVLEFALKKNILLKYIYLLKNGQVRGMDDFDADLIVNSRNIDSFTKVINSIDLFSKIEVKKFYGTPVYGGKIPTCSFNLRSSGNSKSLHILNTVSKIGFGEKNTLGFGFIYSI